MHTFQGARGEGIPGLFELPAASSFWLLGASPPSWHVLGLMVPWLPSYRLFMPTGGLRDNPGDSYHLKVFNRVISPKSLLQHKVACSLFLGTGILASLGGGVEAP